MIHLSDHFTYGKLLRFALPSIVMNIFSSLYIIADGYFVANFTGKTEFAAVNLIMPVLNILGTIGYMFGVGGSALIANERSENQRKATPRAEGRHKRREEGVRGGGGGRRRKPPEAGEEKREGKGQKTQRKGGKTFPGPLFVGVSKKRGWCFVYFLMKKGGKGLIIGLTSAAMFLVSEAFAHPFSALFLRDAEKLLPDAVHAFRIVSVAYLFTGMAVFGSGFFTALNNGQVSALISFLRTFVFELGAVLLLPVLLGVDGIWYSAVFAELMAAATGVIFMLALRRKYHY